MGLTEKPDYNHVTILYREMEICSEFLHCTHEEFSKFDLTEKSKWYAFVEMKIARQSDTQKKEKEREQHQDSHAQNMIENRQRKPSGQKVKSRIKK